MSSCIINRNDKNVVIGATTPNGEASILFNQIHSNLFLADGEHTAEVLSSIYTPAIEKIFKDSKNNVHPTGEPKLFYKSSSNQVYDNLGEMLVAGEVGESIMGYKHPKTDGFIPAVKFNTEASPRSRAIRNAYQEGFISHERVLSPEGKSLFKGEGQFKESSRMHGKGARFNFILELGAGNVKVDRYGLIDPNFSKDVLPTIKNDGTTGVVSVEEIETTDALNKANLIAYKTLREAQSLRPDQASPKDTNNEERLNQALVNFLSTMGFELTTLEDYQANYKTRYGQDPDIKAIADIANKVVAIAKGEDVTKELLEEVSHLALEFYSNDADTFVQLATVHLTPEYAKYAEQYRAKYSPFFEGSKLEEQIRKEVLGKILAKSLVEGFNTMNKSEAETSIISMLKNLWDKFSTFLKARFKSYHQKTLDSLNKEIARSIFSAEISNFANKNAQKTFFYDIKGTEIENVVDKLKVAKESTFAIYQNILNQNVPDREALNRISDNMAQIDLLNSVAVMAGTTEKQLKAIYQQVDTVAKDRTGEKFITSDTSKLFLAIDNHLIDILNSIRADLSETREFSSELVSKKKEILKTLDRVINLHMEIKPRMDKDLENYAYTLVKAALDKNPALTEEQKAELIEQTRNGLKDINAFQRLFGTASTSSNLFMNYLHSRVSGMSFDINFDTRNIMQPILDEIFSKGLDKYQKNVIRFDENGNDTGYYWGPLNHHQRDLDIINLRAELLSEATKTPKEKIIQNFKEGATPNDILALYGKSQGLSQSQIDESISKYTLDFRKQSEVFNELPRTEAYYAERDARYSTADISDHTIATMTNISQERAVLMNQFLVNGRIDRTKMEEFHKSEESDINNQVAVLKEPFTNDGLLYEGLELVNAKELTDAQVDSKLKEFNLEGKPQEFIDKLRKTIAEDLAGNVILLTSPKSELIEEARIALDYANLNILYRAEIADKTKGIVDEEFLSELDKKQVIDPEEAYEFLTANSTFVLNSKYYDQLDGNTSYIEAAEKYVKSLTIKTNEELATKRNYEAQLEEYKRLNAYHKALLRRGRSKKNPLEIDAHHLPSATLAKILEIESAMSEIKVQMKIPKADEKQNAKQLKVNRVPNESFQNSLVEFAGVGNGTSDHKKLEFMEKHMNKGNLESYNKFSYAVNNMLLGISTDIKPYYQKFIDSARQKGRFPADLEAAAKDVTNPAAAREAREKAVFALKMEFAEAHLASYFIKFEPEGLQDFKDALRSGEVKLSDLFNEDTKAEIDAKYDMASYLDINPDYTWLKEVGADTTINNKFDVNGTYKQANVNKYYDKAWFDHYGIDPSKYLSGEVKNISEMTASKNVEEFELLQKMISIREMTIEKYGDKGRTTPYLRPQVTKTGLEDLTTLDAKEFLKDILKNRPDEKIYGEQVGAMNVREINARLIPKYYQSKIDDTTELTKNVLQAAAMDLYQGVAYSHKRGAERDLKAIEFAVQHQKWQQEGRPGQKFRRTAVNQNSEYAQWVKDYTDYMLYGIKQTRQLTTTVLGKEVDLTNLINKFQGLTRFSNLAFNPFVDGTSFTTGVYNNVLSRFVGDYYATDAADRGNKIALSGMRDYFSETGEMNKKSHINTAMEIFNLENFNGKLDNSSFGRGMRWVSEAGYKGAKAANMPVGPRNLFTVLADARWVKNHSSGELQFHTFSSYREMRLNQEKGLSVKQMQAEFKQFANDSFYDNFTIEDNKIIPNQKFIDKYPENTEQVFREFIKDLSVRARTLCEYADGTLNEADQTAAQRDVIMNTLMMHRGWLPLLLSRFFKKKQYSMSLGKYEEGTVQTLFRLIYKAYNLKSINAVVADMDQVEKQNLKRLSVDTAMTIALFLLIGLAMGDDDEDETPDGFLTNLGKYIAIRTAAEVAQQQVISIPATMVDVLKNPITIMKSIEAMQPVAIGKELVFLDFEALGERVADVTPLKRYGQLTDIEEKMNAYIHFNSSVLYNLSPENMDAVEKSRSLGWFFAGGEE